MDERTSAELDGAWGNAFRYDVEHAPCRYDIEFWRQLVRRTGARRILELGCGTGRLAVPLIEAAAANGDGVGYLGVDFSLEMLDAFAARLAAADPVVAAQGRTACMDMRALELDERFDLVVIPLNSLSYLHTSDEQIACLAGVRDVLAEGGRLAFELPVPKLQMLADGVADISPPTRMELDFEVPEMGVTRFMRTSADRYDPATQTDYATAVYDLFYVDGRHERYVSPLRWHMYFRAELELLLHSAGLTVVDRFGGHDFQPFDGSSRHYLWVCGVR